ncbi:MAG: PQQ-like beta-propeller repeat protein, partial [Rhodospirillales bacterium]|nr:PQQ-like beta-propeller repeat protein [Rhodospirillales bacterium]
DEEDGHVGGGLAFEDGKVFATTGFAEVISLDATNGKILWRRKLEAPFRTAPTVRGNRVFALTLRNKLFSLNGSTGETLWSHSGIEEVTSFLGGASPAVDSGVVIAPYSSGELVALKVENGQVLWSDSLNGNRRYRSSTTLSSIRGRPVIDRGIVIAISNNDQIVAINLRTGRRIWDRAIGGIESPWVAGGFIFFLTNNSELVAMTRQTGRIHWIRPLPQWEDLEDQTGRIIWTGPVLTSDRLIVAGSSGEALSISPYSGTILGKVEMPDGVTIGPVAAGNTLYFLSDDADLVAYR